MAAPSLFQAVQGMAVISADNLNSLVQSCDTFAELRGFIGATGQQVFARGQSAPNDGLGGTFYWSSTSTAADNNTSVIKPSGVGSTGAWILCVDQTEYDGNLRLTGSFIQTAPVTVAMLPVPASPGMRCFVSDATATTFNSIVVGGGANMVPVFYDGTNWRIG